MALKCDGTNWGPCSDGGVTHIDEKGFAYCTTHGIYRRDVSGVRCRKLRVWELRLMESGQGLPSYKPGPKPKPDSPPNGGVKPLVLFTIRADLEALLAKARDARAEAQKKHASAAPDDYRDATLRWQALNEVVNDLERTFMHFKRPATAASLEDV